MLVHIKDIVKDARARGYSIGAFNAHNLETVLGIAKAAVRAKSPAIIQVSESAIKYMGLKPVTHIVSTVAKNIAAPVPIALHLDHGKSFESVCECMRAGFTSVHIDASSLPLDENIELTKQVVKLAHQQNVWVQGEIGSIMGGHGDVHGIIENIPIAKLEDVVKFVHDTGVDTISAAVGTAHGAYDNEYIEEKLLADIIEKTKKPFILHGGSGLPDDKLAVAVSGGVSVINIGTDIKVAFSDVLKKTCRENPKENDPRNLLRPSMDAVEEVVFNKMKLFGSAGKIKVPSVRT